MSCEAVERKRGRYQLDDRARRWLDPRSPQYIGGFIEFNYAQWEWWSQLEEMVRSGQPVDIHDFAPDDPRWRDYIHAMHQLARLAAPEVAAAIPLPRGAKHVLDLGGGAWLVLRGAVPAAPGAEGHGAGPGGQRAGGAGDHRPGRPVARGDAPGGRHPHGGAGRPV